MPQQDEMILTLESADFPCDRLRVRRVTGAEAVSRFFDLRIEVVCLDHEPPPADAMAGAPVTLVMERFEGVDRGWHGVRRLHGMIAEVEDLLATHAERRVLRLRVVPRAFALTLVETQDIFLGHDVPEILRAKVRAVGLEDAADLRLTGSYAPREFVVQYKETDHAFVSRLAEHLGVSYFFLHEDGGERLIFTDHRDGFARIDPVPYAPTGETRDVFALTATRRVVPAYFAVTDYNYRTPLVDLSSEENLAEGFAGGVFEVGSHHKTPDEAAALARVRAEESRATQLVYEGRSAVPALFAGARVTITDHPDLGSIDLLILEVEHDAVQVVAGGEEREVPHYRNRFRAIPADRTYRPPRVTPRPRIAGLLTAIVDPGAADPDARYAQIDEQGRYLVRFIFDAGAPGERPASRRVRMIQNHAGENYGTHFPLKPGIEVVVAFIDGDPDRPLIVGAVPNPIKPSPVTHDNPGVHRIRTSTGITIDIVE